MPASRRRFVLRQMKSGGGGPGYAVKKSGHATVGLVGFPRHGEVHLLNQITDRGQRGRAYPSRPSQ